MPTSCDFNVYIDRMRIDFLEVSILLDQETSVEDTNVKTNTTLIECILILINCRVN